MQKAQQSEQGSFLDQYRVVQWAMQFPALTLMVFLRPRDIGFRILNPLVLIAVTLALIVVSFLAIPNHEEARPLDLATFAILFFVFGIGQRVHRWRQVNHNAKTHSFYLGSSPFDFAWLPRICRRNRRIARFVDPIVCAAIGVWLLPYSHVLACWLVFSGFALRSYEAQVFEKERHRNLDLLDSLIISEIQAQAAEQYEEAPAKRQQASTSGGLSTGLGADIQGRIARAKQRPQ